MTDDLYPERAADRADELAMRAPEDSPLHRLIMDVRRRYAPRPTSWTGLAGDQSRAMTAQWMRELAQWPIEAVAEGFEVHMNGERGQFFPSLGEVSELAGRCHRHRQANAEQSYVASTTGHCNGNGWIDGDDGVVPCGRCNPVLRTVFNDRRKWRRYLNGESLSSLGVGVEKVSGRLVSDVIMPESCKTAHPDQEELFGEVVR